MPDELRLSLAYVEGLLMTNDLLFRRTAYTDGSSPLFITKIQRKEQEG